MLPSQSYINAIEKRKSVRKYLERIVSRSRDERIRRKINKKIDNCRPNKENVRK
jgi:transcription initiation factor IIE alpha subunit